MNKSSHNKSSLGRQVNESFDMKTKDKERFELFLISNLLVEAQQNSSYSSSEGKKGLEIVFVLCGILSAGHTFVRGRFRIDT